MRFSVAYRRLCAAICFALTAFGAIAPAASQSGPPIWTGVYLGLHAGGGWGRIGGSDVDVSISPRGALGGVHAGYNFQSGNLVFGAEGDFSAANLDGARTDGLERVDVSTSYLASLRGRLGFTTGPALLYVTGGVAFTNWKLRATDGVDTFSASGRDTGWVVGGGAEFMFASNWSARLEGLHYRFSLDHPDAFDASPRYRVNALRAGLTYKF
jgi:outer membrane immunogenic protein